ncbi:MAG: hypothetical protein LUH16_03480 [Clostridiales bacterium]|nr:hypothetical protein [Clostridiales bacterium]
MRVSDTGACIQKSTLLNGQEGEENQSRRTGAAAEENRFRDEKAAKPHRPIFPKKCFLPEQKPKRMISEPTG